MQALNELLLKYKILQSWKRALITLIFGLTAPVAYSYLQSEVSIIEAAKEESLSRKEQTETKLNGLIKKKKDAPRLEEQKKFTEEQLVEARKHLPDNYFIDQILNKTGLAAMKAKVDLLSFTPGAEATVQGEEQYKELPLALKVRGSYSGIGQFVDNLVHFENMVHVRNLKIKAENRETVIDTVPSGNTSPSQIKSLATRLKEELKDVNLEATMDLVIFRSLRSGEGEAFNNADQGAPLKEKRAKEASKQAGQDAPNPQPSAGGDSFE